MKQITAIKRTLDPLVQRFETTGYIAADPIAVPHGFDDPRDQEVIGLFAAIMAWGQRRTVLNKLAELCERMRYRPYRFVLDFKIARDAPRLDGFKHRTFQTADAVHLSRNLGLLLREHTTVENLFSRHLTGGESDIGAAIDGFSKSVLFAESDTPPRLSKHLARPSAGSACKRLCMYARWMVRPGPFDLGVWKSVRTDQLVLPLDVHSGRQARRLGLLERRANDWKAAMELTVACRLMNATDPSRYDLALFGMGAYGVSAASPSEGRSVETESASPTV